VAARRRARADSRGPGGPARRARKEILPDQATTAYLDRHGAVEGIAREPATYAVEQVEVSGTPSATVTFGSETLSAPSGVRYTPSANVDGTGGSVVLNGSGKATAYARAQTAGTAGNAPALTVLNWSNAPANANPSVTVIAITSPGVDTEADADYAARIISRRQERPASGNRADWADWPLGVTGVADAVVYPRLHPTYGVDTLGAVTVLALGPAQGDSPTNARIIGGTPGAVLASVAGFIEGTLDKDGGTTGTRKQLRPVTMRGGDYAIEAPSVSAQDLDMQVTLAAAFASPFAYSAGYVVLASPAPSAATFSLVGNVVSVFMPGSQPLPILVHIGTGAYRGGYYFVTPSSVVYDGVANTDFVVPTMPAAAVAGTVVLPGLPNWSQIRAGIFAHFDQLGPGDTSPASRWPGEETRLRSKLYRSALVADLVAQYDARGALKAGVAGVLNAVVVTPGGDVAPAAKTIVTLGTLLVRPV
jgi:hypothetical protein